MWMQEQTDGEWGRVSLLEEVSTEPRAAAGRLQAVLKLSLRADLDSLYLLLEVLNILSSRAQHFPASNNSAVLPISSSSPVWKIPERQKEGTCHIRLTEGKESMSPHTVPRKGSTEYVGQVSGSESK